ncbi:S-layer homology domain-containing protein [Tumebacillus sp. DT12]|uniref:S-layer homology domain-containing protein n=1 Tax=Tumebacillus lacus TaxID=2995335 RepID=A0ABT3X659_9BACL|nr:S-layer homology domain-containing protein [Tumebacillus lacus]MCX7572388.1 S-layer homology domain-containing protein [Tumebacillus lacus]
MKRMAKWGVATVAFAVLMAGVPAPGAMDHTAVAVGDEFRDVPSNAWYAPYVRGFVKTGIVNGFGDGSFKPEESITRAQFVQILYKVMGQPSVTGTDTGYADATSGWYVPALVYAKKNGGLDQFPAADRFEEGKPLTRGEAARLLWNLIGYDEERQKQPDAVQFPQAFKAGSAGQKEFADQASFPGYAVLPVRELAANGVLNGYGDGTFKPERSITRAEATKMLDTALRKVGYPALVSGQVSQAAFIASMYTVLSKASTMEGRKFDYSQNVPEPRDARTSPNGGGYTAEKVGIKAEQPSGQVSAALAANWLGKWAVEARNVSFQYNVSSDPYEWAQINGWFEGTSVKGRNDVIQPDDLDQLNRNLQAWLIGYRMEGHTVYFHWPMVPYEPMFKGIHARPGAEGEAFKDDNRIRETMKKATAIYNQAKVTVENGKVTYWEPKSATERAFIEMGVYGDRNTKRMPHLFTASYDDLSNTYPIQDTTVAGVNYYYVGMSPVHLELVGHGGYASFDYSFKLNASHSVISVEMGSNVEGDGSVGTEDANIITNYPLMAVRN